MIKPIGLPVSIKVNNEDKSISHRSQQDTEYRQPQISDKQNYQNQLADIADDMSMVATQFSQRFGKWLD